MRETINIHALDPHLQKTLKAYGVAPKRDPASARRTRAKFVMELNTIFNERESRGSLVGVLTIANWVSAWTRPWKASSLFAGRRALSSAAIALGICIALLFGGSGLSAYAASSSLPGDALYPLKITVERVQAGFTLDAGARARLYLNFAGQHVSEIQSLMDQGRYAHLVRAVDELETNIQGALNAAERLSQTNPAQGAALNAEITAGLREYSDTLSQLLVDSPAEAQPFIEDALMVLQQSVISDDDGGATPIATATISSSAASTTTPTPTSTPRPTATTPSGGAGNGGGDDDNDNDDDDDDDDDD